MPSAAERIELEARVSDEAEVKWKSAIANAQEDLDASKVTIQSLLKENLYLKTNLQYERAESEKRVAEIQFKFQNKVRFLPLFTSWLIIPFVGRKIVF